MTTDRGLTAILGLPGQRRFSHDGSTLEFVVFRILQRTHTVHDESSAVFDRR